MQAQPSVATIIGPGEGETLWVLGDRYTLKVAGEQTNGRYAFIEQQVMPQSGPPPHIHHAEDEAFYVLKGEVTFFSNDETIRATTGTFIHIPQGTLHTFRNEGTEPAHMLVLITPAGFEQYFKEVGHTAGGANTTPPPVTPATYERLMATAPRYNLEIKPPPQE